jgi:hypothetical protein
MAMDEKKTKEREVWGKRLNQVRSLSSPESRWRLLLLTVAEPDEKLAMQKANLCLDSWRRGLCTRASLR